MKTNWYKTAVVYQVYPLSFMDANNDGWGDIPGTISRLDHIKELGATAVWFSPFYQSPFHDFGYDISDYRKIDAIFGTMEDFDRLLAECHDRDLKVIIDMAVNHTSTEHPWFKEALSSPDSPYRDYYIIRKGKRKNGKLLPPTNWHSTFTGSAWERIGDTDEFYLHLFCKEQADLNWENPQVRQEIVDILNFWLEKGVDGFRFDVFNVFSKAHPLKDDKGRKSFQRGESDYVDGPRMHEFLKELNERSFSLFDCYTVGESFRPSPEASYEYVKEENRELNSIFSFGHLNSDNIAGAKYFWKPFDLPEFKRGLLDPQTANYREGWNTLVLENHDNARSVSRISIDTKHYRFEAATMLATVTFMGFGIPFIYMGEEIGMTNCRFRSMDELRDPVSHFIYDLLRSFRVPSNIAFNCVKYGARDHARVPMQWDDSVNAGFNAGARPWQCVNPAYKEISVKKDRNSGKSVYRYYQKLLKIKKGNETAVCGETKEYAHKNRQIIAYSRCYRGNRLFVIGNFSSKKAAYTLPAWLSGAAVLINNYNKVEHDKRKVTLKPYQAVVFEKKG